MIIWHVPEPAPAAPLVPTAVAALAAGVTAATIRDWRRRGLLERKGGTPRRPLYDLRDIKVARDSPKPRRTDI